MFERLKRARDAALIRRRPLADDDWAVLAEMPLLDHLAPHERDTLRQLATLFARRTTFVGTHGLVVTEFMRAAVAVQACLPILHLGLDYYRELRTVVLYPGTFVAEREHVDDAGVVHAGVEELDGESMAGGPLALSWEEVDPAREDTVTNVVLHECAHKLDELTGSPNGLPPLHRDMSVAAWSAAFNAAYAHFTEQVDADADDEDLAIDDYAATDPAEFFAVMTEAFFTTPARVAEDYPAVYRELTRFYRQDPRRGVRHRLAPGRARHAPDPT
jgi:hypothetical protein